jgi:glucokinase
MTSNADELNTRVIAVDLGGTNIRAALCDADGHILKRTKQRTLPEQGAEAVIGRIVQSVREVMLEGQAVRAVGVASPGPLNPFTGIVMAAPNLHWHNVPLRDELRKALNLPIEINNDANLAALGEQRYGAARGKKDMAYVTLSTGIGCGVILNNQMVLGARGQATELGHMSVAFNSSVNYNGLPGALEALAAGPAIATLAQQKVNEGRSSHMVDLAGGHLNKITAKEVGEAATAGDAVALEVVAFAGRVIGIGLVNLLHLFDPEIVVIGGSVSLMGDVLWRPMLATVAECALTSYQDIPIVPAALGDDCGLLGAAALAASALAINVNPPHNVVKRD